MDLTDLGLTSSSSRCWQATADKFEPDFSPTLSNFLGQPSDPGPGGQVNSARVLAVAALRKPGQTPT
jgi:hypothetical protein